MKRSLQKLHKLFGQPSSILKFRRTKYRNYRYNIPKIALIAQQKNKYLNKILSKHVGDQLYEKLAIDRIAWKRYNTKTL